MRHRIALLIVLLVSSAQALDLSCATVVDTAADCPCSCMNKVLTCECADNSLDVSDACSGSQAFVKDGALQCSEQPLTWHNLLTALLLSLSVAAASCVAWRCVLRPFLYSKTARQGRVIRKWSFHGDEYFEYGHSDDEDEWPLTSVPSKPLSSVVVKTEPRMGRPTRVKLERHELEASMVVVDQMGGAAQKKTNHSCGHCGQGFSRISAYHQHVYEHTGVKAYACQDCGKAFKTQSNLTSHRAVHKKKSHMCDVCGKGFARNSDYNRHYKIHFKKKQQQPRKQQKQTPQQHQALQEPMMALPMFVKTELLPAALEHGAMPSFAPLVVPPLPELDLPELDFGFGEVAAARKASDDAFDFHFLPRDDSDMTDIFNLAAEDLFGLANPITTSSSSSNSPLSGAELDLVPTFDWSSPDLGGFSTSSASSLSPFSDGSMSPLHLGGNSPVHAADYHLFNVAGRMIEWKRVEFSAEFRQQALNCKSDSWHVCPLLQRPLYDAVAVKTTGSSELQCISEQAMLEWLTSGKTTCPLTHQPIESVCIDSTARAFVRSQFEAQIV